MTTPMYDARSLRSTNQVSSHGVLIAVRFTQRPTTMSRVNDDGFHTKLTDQSGYPESPVRDA
ncbi:MAG: hypothetical protein QOD56_1103 [Gammaproteobacteria bacterium]|jgi:hypothetical protein|nr:hypothetical protein [Gammaproteobacteria bacterium]